MINIEELIKKIKTKNGKEDILYELVVGENYSLYYSVVKSWIPKRIQKLTIFSDWLLCGLPIIVRNDDTFSEVDSVNELEEYSKAESELDDKTKSHRVELSSYRTDEENVLIDELNKKWNDLQEEKAKMSQEEYDKACEAYLSSLFD